MRREERFDGSAHEWDTTPWVMRELATLYVDLALHHLDPVVSNNSIEVWEVPVWLRVH
jgi:hypothetical protein